MWPEDPGVTAWRGLDLNSLQVDEAYLNITSNKDEVYLYSISEDCDRVRYSYNSMLRPVTRPCVGSLFIFFLYDVCTLYIVLHILVTMTFNFQYMIQTQLIVREY